MLPQRDELIYVGVALSILWPIRTYVETQPNSTVITAGGNGMTSTMASYRCELEITRVSTRNL